MGEHKNMDEFNLLVGAVMAQLYESFPNPITIDDGDIGQRVGLSVTEDPQFADFSEPVYNIGPFPSGAAFNGRLWSTLSWLRSEGFIRADGDVGTQEAVLTLNGLAVLNSKPASLEPTFGQALSAETKKAAADARNSVITNLVGQLVGTAAKHFMGS